MSNGGRADGPLVLWSFGLNGGLTGGREREMADSNILIMTMSMLQTNNNKYTVLPKRQLEDHISITSAFKRGQMLRKKLDEKG